jgi:hypothetical protein
MAKKKSENTVEVNRIEPSDIDVGGIYRTYVNDLVRVESFNGETNKFVLYNISGAHRQWIDPANICLIEKIRQSR